MTYKYIKKQARKTKIYMKSRREEKPEIESLVRGGN
jgi:hypothetical protein